MGFVKALYLGINLLQYPVNQKNKNIALQQVQSLLPSSIWTQWLVPQASINLNIVAPFIFCKFSWMFVNE